jgi:hypothetical protein
VIRLSVSDLETWRYWKANEDATLEDLIARLTKKEPPTPQMAAGAAFAKLMEHAKHGSELDAAKIDGWEFVFALEGSIALPPVRELKAEVVFETPAGPVTLVGKVDGIDGKIHDQKLTEDFDAERYLDSLQWRAYCVMFGAREFVYDVFRAKYERGRGYTDSDGEYVRGEPTGLVTVLEYHPVTFYAYPDIRADIERAVAELAEVVVTYGIPKQGATP